MPKNAEQELKSSFHQKLVNYVTSTVPSSRENRKSYGRDCEKAIRLLAANAHHTVKPKYLDVANCAYMYKNLDTNLWEAIAADPVLGTWVGHMFFCNMEQDIQYTYYVLHQRF